MDKRKSNTTKRFYQRQRLIDKKRRLVAFLARYVINADLPNSPEEDFSKYEKLAQDIFMTNRLYFLHDSEDEILILNAVARNCGVFLTMDYKTIWNVKNKIEAVVPLSVSRPLEYWNYVKRLL